MATRSLVLCLLASVLGCGPRVEVAKDKILAQIDSLLGEIDVKKKEAETGVQNMSAGIDQITKGRIEAKVKQTQFSDKLAQIESKIADADKGLGRLRDHLQQDKNVELSGTTYTPAQLKEMADKLISARKKLATEAEALKSSEQRLGAVVASLEQREKEGREKLNSLKQNLEEIDAKAVALKSIKDAQTLAGGTATLDFENVEQSVRELATKIDVELSFHEQKAKEATATDIGSIESIIEKTSTSSDTISEIDKVLGGKK